MAHASLSDASGVSCVLSFTLAGYRASRENGGLGCLVVAEGDVVEAADDYVF